MKIAISGKGGVGKTTLAALLASEAAIQGYRVFAVDADPNPNLALALGLPEMPTPLVELKDLIEERLGALEGFFRLNPRVDDIPERFSVEHQGVQLLVMGGIRQGGAGCACPENAFLRSLLQHLMLARDEWMIVDLEAGLEHLGRATAQGVDALLIVVEPDRRSLETAHRIQKLAGEIGLHRLYAVGNKIREPEDAQFINQNLSAIELLALLPESPAVRQAARTGMPLQDPELAAQARAILNALQTRSQAKN
ncbi:MAG: AAA family ATPase [Anaerolineae bacterium]